MRKYNRDEVMEYFRTHSAAETEAKYGISRGTVFIYAKEYGIKKGQGNFSKFVLTDEIAEYKKTHTFTETANHFNLNKNELYGHYIRNGLETKKQYDIESIREYIANHTAYETQEKFQLSTRTLLHLCRKNNISYPHPAYHKPKIKRTHKQKASMTEMVKYLAEKYTINAIGQLLNLTDSAISKILHEVY